MLKTLTLEDLQKHVPSIFTETPAKRCSEKYQHISTMKIVDRLLEEGFTPVAAIQSSTRLVNNIAYTKHLLRFRQIDAKPSVGGLFPEIVLINSHDGLSSYQLLSGLYRLICGNGLIAGYNYAQIRVRHQGNILDDVIEGSYEVISNSQKMVSQAELMSQIELTPTEIKTFAEAAHTVRFGDSEIGKSIAPPKLLQVRRFDDDKWDLFTVYNRIQENTIKGGLRGYKKNKRGHLTKTQTRAVKSIDQQTALNRELWTLAEKIMQSNNSMQ